MSRGDFGANSPFGRPPNYGSVAPGYNNSGGNQTFVMVSNKTSSAIAEINRSAASLNRLSNQLGTSKDGVELRAKLHDIQQSTKSSINEATGMLKEVASKLDTFNKMEKLKFDKLKSEFMTAVKSYSVTQRKIVDKEQAIPLFQANSYRANEGNNGYMADDEYKQRLIEEERRNQHLEQLQQRQQQVEDDTTAIEERSRKIYEIEADIIDVNEIFKDLSMMVHEQGEIINTIEANVDSTAVNVVAANTQLYKANQYQKKARTKMCCVIVILVVVAVVVVIIVVTTVKK